MNEFRNIRLEIDGEHPKLSRIFINGEQLLNAFEMELRVNINGEFRIRLEVTPDPLKWSYREIKAEFIPHCPLCGQPGATHTLTSKDELTKDRR